MKIAIVCTAFGTARPESLTPFYKIIKTIQTRFSPETVLFAFSSGFACKKLAELNIQIQSPVETVEQLLHTHDRVVIQPFQFVAGGEYEKTVAEIRELSDSQRCVFGEPLIRSVSDIPAIGDQMIFRKNQNSIAQLRQEFRFGKLKPQASSYKLKIRFPFLLEALGLRPVIFGLFGSPEPCYCFKWVIIK